MKLRSGRGLLLLLVMVLLASSVGCPNSTVIGAGNGAVELVIFNVNQGRWADQPLTDRAFLTIRRIQIRPMDPATSALLGTQNEFTLTPGPVFINMQQPQYNPVSQLPDFGLTGLSQGTYEVVELELTSFNFTDNAPGDPSTCESNLNFYTPPTVTITNFPTPLTFTVTRDQDVMVALTFDVAAMVVAMNAASDCTAGGCIGALPFCSPGPIDATQFGDLYATYLTLD